MEPEVQARAGLPVVLVNRDGVYVIIAVLGVSIVGCACVLTYSLGNYGKLKKYAEEARDYISHHYIKAAVEEHSGSKRRTAADATGPSDDRSVTVDVPMSNASADGSRADAGPPLGTGRNNSEYTSVVRNVNDALVVSTRQQESGAAAADLQHWNASTAGCDSGDASLE